MVGIGRYLIYLGLSLWQILCGWIRIQNVDQDWLRRRKLRASSVDTSVWVWYDVFNCCRVLYQLDVANLEIASGMHECEIKLFLINFFGKTSTLHNNLHASFNISTSLTNNTKNKSILDLVQVRQVNLRPIFILNWWSSYSLIQRPQQKMLRQTVRLATRHRDAAYHTHQNVLLTRPIICQWLWETPTIRSFSASASMQQGRSKQQRERRGNIYSKATCRRNQYLCADQIRKKSHYLSSHQHQILNSTNFLKACDKTNSF